MNDFTKEELESLIGAFSWIDEDPAYRAVGGWDKELQSKIKFMIENYCEHETNAKKPCEHQHDGLLYAGEPLQSKCRLCGEFFKMHSFKDEMEVNE